MCNIPFPQPIPHPIIHSETFVESVDVVRQNMLQSIFNTQWFVF